jgi:hypothetical protein
MSENQGITRLCIVCGEWRIVHCTPEQFRRWKFDGVPIQVALAGKEEHELFNSGICADCVREIYRECGLGPTSD